MVETTWKEGKWTFQLDEVWPRNSPEVLHSRGWTEGSSSLLDRFWQSQSHTTSQVHPGKSHRDGWSEMSRLQQWLNGLFSWCLTLVALHCVTATHPPESYLWKASSLASGLDVQYWGSGNVPRLGWSKQGDQYDRWKMLSLSTRCTNQQTPPSYLFGDLAGHLLCKVPVLTDSVEELTALHHLHDDQEPGSVSKEWLSLWKPKKPN